MMGTVKAWAATSVLASAAVLAGCGAPSIGRAGGVAGSARSHAQPSSSTLSTPSSAATTGSTVSTAPTGELLGQYTTTFTGDEQYVPPSEPKVHLIGFVNPGPWTLSLTTNRATFGPQGGSVLPVGPSWSYTADQVVFAAGCPFQEPEQPPTAGVYSYALSGATLSFVEISDSCLYRAAYLSTHSWQRK
jgi:hypothetical protein